MPLDGSAAGPGSGPCGTGPGPGGGPAAGDGTPCWVRHCSYTPCACGGADVVDGATVVVVDCCGAFVVEHAGMSTFESGLTLLLDTFERLAP